MNTFKTNTKAEGSVDALISIAVAVCVLIAVFTIIPIIGEETETAVTYPANSSWNASCTTESDLDAPVTLWEKTQGLLILAVIVSILAVVIGVIMVLRGPGRWY